MSRFRLFILRAPDPDCGPSPKSILFIPIGIRCFADSFTVLPPNTSSATCAVVFTAFAKNFLAVTLEKRKHQAAKETAHTAQSVTVVKSASRKYGYLSTVLSLVVVLLVQIASAIAAINISLHDRNVE